MSELTDAISNDEILLSNSFSQGLQDCERKFHYDYVRGWSSPPTRAMNLGSWFHALVAAEMLRKGIEEGTILFIPESINLGFENMERADIHVEGKPFIDIAGATYDLSAEGVLSALVDHQWAPLPKEMHEEYSDDDKYYANVGADTFPLQVLELFDRWQRHWRKVDEKVLLVEQEWTRQDEVTGLWFRGRVDSVVQRADGFVVVRDEKTTSSQPSMTYRLTNLQTLLYAWGVAPLLESHGLKPRMVELDYVITNTPGLLRLKKKLSKEAKEKEWEYEPYANVGHMDAGAFLAQCNAMDVDPNHEAFKKIHDRLKGYTNDDHPFYQRWEMVASQATIRQVLDEHAESWPRAKALLLGDRQPVRNLHPVLCGMCRWSEQCAIEFQGGTPKPMETRQTLPVLTDGGFKDISVEELA